MTGHVVELHLPASTSKLRGKINPSLLNLKHLAYLDLSNNDLGAIPRSMGNLCNLKLVAFLGVNLSQDISEVLEIFSGCVSRQLISLDLWGCQLHGQLTNQLGKLKNLNELYLSENLISGPIPLSIGELSSLRVLRLDGNKLKGNLPASFGQLANLEGFYVYDNLLEGVVTEIHFANLTRLKRVLADDNRLTLRLSPDWVPPFQLESLSIRCWDVGSEFPLWLRSQKQLEFLVMSNSMIQDSIPSWFWNSVSQFRYLDLSDNKIYGQIPNLPSALNYGSHINLSVNSFSGPLPQFSSNLSFLDLSRNSISGSLFHFLCSQSNETMMMAILNLGDNLLSGEIPDCWTRWKRLLTLRLDYNNFTGRIPSSMGSLSSLISLKLHRNNIRGILPLSLKSCTKLQFLDIGENQIYGNITEWLSQGRSLPELKVLGLRSNKFSGHIPNELCDFFSLQFVDLANNNILGSLTRCMGNFTAMEKKINTTGFDCIAAACYSFPVMKGRLLEYSSTLYLVRGIDVSNNKLSGEIPMEVTNLFELQLLNLSHNRFTGSIPESIGAMRSLEVVDFSTNKLSGSIPRSMSDLTFLSRLNLSWNNLTGEIPSSTQLQSFDPSSYVGNQLCGPPLQKCFRANGSPGNVGDDESGEKGNWFETFWFCLGLPFGFVVGFWSVVGPFFIRRRRGRSCCGI